MSVALGASRLSRMESHGGVIPPSAVHRSCEVGTGSQQSTATPPLRRAAPVFAAPVIPRQDKAEVTVFGLSSHLVLREGETQMSHDA